MGSTQNPMTLETLASRLEALERENTRLRTEVAALRTEGLPSATLPRAVEKNGHSPERGTPTSRRMWLKRAAGAAVASVAAGAMLQRDTDTAAADHTTELVNAKSVIAHQVIADPDGAYPAVLGTTTNQGGPAIQASNYASSLLANSEAGVGVFGHSTASTGVKGKGKTGVKGESTATGGYGVHGVGWAGVVGESSTANWAAVAGEHSGEGVGVSGLVTSVVTAATQGVNYGTGPGVKGLSSGDGVRGEGKVGVHGKSGTTGGNAVWGEGAASATGVAGTSTSGYGGYFRGGKAQLRLALGSRAGKPTAGAHVKGEIYMDSAATLYVCTVAGTPGTWRRLTTTTA